MKRCMFNLVVLFFFCLFLSSGVSYGSDANGFYFIDRLNGWIVGDEGKILHTTDGGHTWNSQKSKTTESLQSVWFTDPDNGWIVGDKGVILHTDNGGKTWKSQNSAISEDFRGVQFTDKNHGWVMGSEGDVLLTDDSGLTWTFENYQPPALSRNRLGAILQLLNHAEIIKNSFEGGKIIYKLPGGQIYIDADMQIDSDGSPRAVEIDDYGQYETSLFYRDPNGQEKYVNAEEIPYIVLPEGFYYDYGIRLGDIAAVIYRDKVEYALFADVGPKDKIGEGSIRLSQLFGEDPFVNGKVRCGIDQDVIYIVFPGSGDRTQKTPEEINRKGRKFFETLGGSAL